MYSQQTFFGPEGIFVAGSVSAYGTMQPAGVQASGCVHLDNRSTAKSGWRVGGSSGCDYDKQLQEVRSLRGGSSSSSQRRSDSKPSGKRSGGHVQKWPSNRKGRGNMVTSHCRASLSDLSTHPDAEENWYRVDGYDCLDGSDSFCLDTSSSCSLMEISPLSTPQRGAVLPFRKPAVWLSRKQQLPVSKSPIKRDPRPSRGPSLRSSKGSLVSTNFQPVSRFSPVPANFPGTRLPPEGSDNMHSTKPGSRDVTFAHGSLRGPQLTDEVAIYDSQARKLRSRSIHASAAVADITKISKSKPKEVWFAGYSQGRSGSKKVSFSQDATQHRSREAGERASISEDLSPRGGICRGKVRSKEVLLAGEGANKVRKPKEVSFVFESRYGRRYARPGKSSSRQVSRSTSCCDEGGALVSTVNAKRRTVSEGMDDLRFDRARVVKGGAVRNPVADDVRGYSDEELSEASDMESLDESDESDIPGPVTGGSDCASLQVRVLYEPLKDADAEKNSCELKNKASKPATNLTSVVKNNPLIVESPARCDLLPPSRTTATMRHSIAEMMPASSEASRIRESPVRSSSAVNLNHYPPSPYEATPPDKYPEITFITNQSRPDEATSATTGSPIAKSRNSLAADSARSSVLPQIGHYYHHPGPSIAIPRAEDAEVSEKLSGTREGLAKSLVAKAGHNSSGIGMPLSPPRDTSKTEVWRSSHQIPPICPYAVSVIHVVDSDVNVSSSPSSVRADGSPKIEVASGNYDQLENATPRHRSSSDVQHSRHHPRHHFDSVAHPRRLQSSSHSQALASPSAMPRLLLGSKSDHDILRSSPSCGSGLSHYDTPSSAPAFLEGGQPSCRHPPPSRTRWSSGSGGYYRHHLLHVCPNSRIPSPVCCSPLPRVAIPLSPSQVSYLSSLSAQSNPRSVSPNARGRRRRAHEEWEGSFGKVDVTRSQQLYEMLSPRSRQWWSDSSHYQLPSNIPCGRSHQLEMLLQALGLSGSSSDVAEPELQDVVKFLSSEDYIVISNAASYLQHLAYNDDSMKNKIREHGVIPTLVGLVRHSETKVQITALGALKNLSFGRNMNENRLLIGSDQGLNEIMATLKKSRVSEVRELLTGLLWNLSSSEDLKMRMIQGCLHDLVEIVMVPHTGWNTEVARLPTARPQAVHWNNELKNTTGTLRNMSSAGESARSFMRSTNGMVDTLLWLLKAGVQQRSAADEKTVENTVCILRNLSYRLELEVDALEAGEDILDREWEQEQRREAEFVPSTFSRRSPGCLAMCVKSHTKDDMPRKPTSSRQTVYNVDFVYPESSVMPKRRKPVYGKSLLWQPEVAFVYLAVIEQYPDSIETLESAAGAVQNLTACRWKWSVYIRNIIRTSNGLRLLADLLSSGHDTVVRAAALTLRNLVEDVRNRAAMGPQAVANIIPRLPLGGNHLGISEETSVALLCCLMELFNDMQENASLFREKEGLLLLTRLARSRDHTVKVTFAAHKACAILWEFKDCKSGLKKLCWDISEYHRMVTDEETQLELEPRGGMARDLHGSSRRKHGRGSKRSSKKSAKKKDRDREREDAGVAVGFIAKGLPRTPEADELQPQSSSSVATMSSPARPPNNAHLSEIPDDPNYQVIPPPPSSARPSNHNRPSEQQVPPLPPATPESPIVPNYESIMTSPAHHAVSSLPAQSGPNIIYQSIGDSPIRSSGGRVDTAMSANMSTTNVSTTNSGPLSVTSDEPEPDPNATYALVDIEKKRASRRAREQKKKEEDDKRERQKQQELSKAADEPVEAWV